MENNDISYTIDYSQALAATAKMQKVYDETGRSAAAAGQKTDSAMQQTAVIIRSTADRAQADTMRMVEGLRRVATGAERTGESLASMFKGTAKAATGFAEMAIAVGLATKAITAHASATNVMEAALNRARAARIGFATVTEGLGGGLAAGAQIAGVLALEKIIEVTYARGRELQKQALESQKSGFSYADTAALDFATRRQGVSPDFFNSAVKATGGVDQLGQKLKELGEIADPFERVHQSFQTLGSDAEKLLPFLGTRFQENVTQAREWGLALDDSLDQRKNVVQFINDVDALKGAFKGVTDDIAGFSKSVGNFFAGALAGVVDAGHGFADFANRTVPGWLNNPGFIDKLSRRELLELPQQTVAGMAPGPQTYSSSDVAVGQKYFAAVGRDREAELSSRVSALRSQLFVTDKTAPGYGNLVSGASFPGGPGARALALQSYVGSNRELDQIKAQKDADEQQKQSLKEIESAQKSVAEIVKQSQLSELSGIEKLKAERDDALAQYGKTRDLVQQINSAFDIRIVAELRKQLDAGHADIVKFGDDAGKAAVSIMDARNAAQTSTFREAFSLNAQGNSKRSDLQLQQLGIDRDRLIGSAETSAAGIFDPDLSRGRNAEASLQRKVALEGQKFTIESDYLNKSRDLQSLGIIAERDQSIATYKTQLDSKLISETAFNAVRKNLEINSQLDLKKLSDKTDADIAAARNAAAVASAKLITETYRSQFDSIKSEVAPLYQTLFEHPTKFPKQLASTVRTAALRPVIDSFSNMTATALHPLIYGGDGQGGLANAMKFGGPLMDLKVESDGSLNVNIKGMGEKGNVKAEAGNVTINGAPSGGGGMLGMGGLGTSMLSIAPFLRTMQVMAGGGSAPAPRGSISSTIDYGGGPIDLGTSYTGGSGPYGGSPIASVLAGTGLLGGGGYAFGGGTTGDGFAGTSTPAGFASGSSRGNSASPLLRNLLGGFGRSNFSGLGANFGIGTANPGGSSIDYSTGGINVTGPSGTTFGSVINSSGAKSLIGGGGMALAESGIFGPNRGTGKGVGEATAGGAMVGFQYGGPIGAAVGAVIGAGIGLGEMAAGVQSDRTKAIQQVSRPITSRSGIRLPIKSPASPNRNTAITSHSPFTAPKFARCSACMPLAQGKLGSSRSQQIRRWAERS